MALRAQHPGAVSVRMRAKHADAGAFLERYAPNMFRSGIFIETPRPRSAGTLVRLEILLRDNSRLLRGDGIVVWVRENVTATEPAGMGVRFRRLDRPGRELVDVAVRRRVELARASAQVADDPDWTHGGARSLLEPDDDFHAELDAAFDAFMGGPSGTGGVTGEGPPFAGDAPIELATGDIEILEVPAKGDFVELEFDLGESPLVVESVPPGRVGDKRPASTSAFDHETRRHSIADAELLLAMMAAAEQVEPGLEDPERTQRLDPETVAKLLTASSARDAPRAPSGRLDGEGPRRRNRRRLSKKLRELEARVGSQRLAAATAEARRLLEDYVARRSSGSQRSRDPIDPEVARKWLRKLGSS